MAGTVGGYANHKQLEDLGYNFINIGADVIALGNYYLDIMDKMKK